MNEKPTRPRPSQIFWCQECGRHGDINDMFQGDDCCIATVIDDLER